MPGENERITHFEERQIDSPRSRRPITDLNVAFYDVANSYFLFRCVLANHSANFSLLEFHERRIAEIWREARNFVTELFDVNASKEFHLFSCLASIEDRV